MTTESVGSSVKRPLNDLWRPLKAKPSDYFTAEEVAKAKSYHRPLKYAAWIGAGLDMVATLVIILTHAAPRLVAFTGVRQWPLQLLLVILMTTVVSTVIGLPFGVWAEFSHEKKWGFSTQTPKGFVVDMAKGLPLGIVIGFVLMGALYAVIRFTSLWWLLGTAVVVVLSVVLGFLFPTVIMPIFNKFTPLEDDDLRTRLAAVAERGKVKIANFFVMDASKRTKKDNAFFAGIGKSRRVVIYDNMLEYPPEDVEVVVAHEVGHYRRHHIRRSLVLGAVTTVVMFGALEVITSSQSVLNLAGVSSLRDPASLPLFMLLFGWISFATRWPGLWLGRWHERQADLDALDLTGHIDAYRGLWRRMSDRNLPDLDPTWWQRVNAVHPPMAERMAFADVWQRSRR